MTVEIVNEHRLVETQKGMSCMDCEQTRYDSVAFGYFQCSRKHDDVRERLGIELDENENKLTQLDEEMEELRALALGELQAAYRPVNIADLPTIGVMPGEGKFVTRTMLAEGPHQHLVNSSTPAIKFDSAKLRYDLIPPQALDALAAVYTYGANKYADRNWEKGMAWGRIFAATMRHLWAFWRRESHDPESGLHHCAHAMWGCVALFTYATKESGYHTWDDRAVNGKPPEGEGNVIYC